MMERKGDWMQTYTGRMFWPIDPRHQEIHIHDIAHALSMMCRYNGHCKRFYSVAEHSVLVSQNVSPENALWGLLHDAPEAYLADIVKPAKPYIAGYKEAERRIMDEVCIKFGLPGDEPPDVKYADTAILADELEQVMGTAPHDWNLPYDALGVVINCLSPEAAKQLFLHRFLEITG